MEDSFWNAESYIFFFIKSSLFSYHIKKHRKQKIYSERDNQQAKCAGIVNTRNYITLQHSQD
jgi:hypothetical protein